jgi:exonuclease III
MISYFLIFSLFINNLQIISSDTECPILPTSLKDRRTDKNKFRIVQYNVEWLFIDYNSHSKCPGSGCTWVNQSEAQIHMEYVANVVNELKPDLINFCEVEGCDELNILSEYLDGTYIPYLKQGTDSGTGQNVGMLTRLDPIVNLYRTENRYDYPIPGSNCGYTGNGNTGVSKHYITEFNINNNKIALIAAHFIAIPTDSERCAQREGQASVLQQVIMNYTNSNYEIIVLGDFNDYDNEVLDMNSHKPKSKVLDILKGISGEFANKYELFNIAETITQNERYSDWYDSDNNCNTNTNKDFSMIDHILVTDFIKKNINNSFIYHGYKEYCGKYNSDHFPVVIDLLI